MDKSQKQTERPARNYLDERADRIKRIADELTGDSDDSGGIDTLYRAYALLSFAKPCSVNAKDVHDAWSLWAIERGYGKHKSLVPFHELSDEIAALDEPFVTAINRAALDAMTENDDE